MTWSPVKYRWQWHVKCCSSELWNLVADARRLKVALGLVAAVPQLVGGGRDSSGGGGQRARSTLRSLLGSVKDAPVNWLRENEFSLEFIGEAAPLSSLTMRIRLEPKGEGTLVTHVLSVVPASLVGKLSIPWAVGNEVYRNFDKLYRDYQEFITGSGETDFFMDTCSLSVEARAEVARASDLLVKQGFRDSWVRLLSQYLSQESDSTLQAMHPYIIADQWGVPRQRVMELFLAATALDLLRLCWQLRCPQCRGICHSKMSLRGVHRRGFCETCDSEFPNHLEHTVELTFLPHPRIRPLKRSDEQLTGPMAAPYIHIQQVLQPQEVKTFSADFLRGNYRVRTLNTDEAQWSSVNLDNKLGHELSAELTDEALKVRCTPEESGVRVRFCNRTAEPQIFCLEDDSWKRELLTARVIINNHSFRTWFPREVLTANDPLPVGKLALLVCDIVDSTSLYLAQGDQESYFLLREYYTFLKGAIAQNNGAVIKSMGDEVTAAFVDPLHATQAALAIQSEFGTFNATLSSAERLTVRLACHYGPCYAVNFNNCLDYFGKTVSLAWSIQKQCRGNDAIFSRALWKVPKVREVLELSAHKLERFRSKVTGMEEQVELFRIS